MAGGGVYANAGDVYRRPLTIGFQCRFNLLKSEIVNRGWYGLRPQSRPKADQAGHPGGVKFEDPPDVTYFCLEGTQFLKNESALHVARIPWPALGGGLSQFDGLIRMECLAESIEQHDRLAGKILGQRLSSCDCRHSLLDKVA